MNIHVLFKTLFTSELYGPVHWRANGIGALLININHGYGICKEKGVKLFYLSWAKFVIKQPRRVAPGLAAEARSAEAASSE